MKTKLIAVTYLVGLAAFLVGCNAPEPFRVMTFNLRYGTAPDGDDAWDLRREKVISTIRSNEPDILGLQEVLAFQARELRAALPEYEFVGVGRDDGLEAGEYAPIMFRRKLFTPLEFGYVWLSPDPDRPGVKGWDAACPRMLTWIRLGFKRAPLHSAYVINTHFDHVGEQARLESARIIRNMTDALGGKPVIVMGDFNAQPDSPPYKVLMTEHGNLAELRDVHRLLDRPEAASGTFHGFRGGQDGARIDWILITRRLEPISYEIDRRPFADRYPSDHYPVNAAVRLLPAW